jgi:opacity protein-like surface antigen
MKRSGITLPILLRLMMAGAVAGVLMFHGYGAELAGVEAAESADVYISLSVAGGFPEVQGMNLAGQEVSRSNAHRSLGAGFKVGVFPAATFRVLGIELEYFGTTGRISAANRNSAEGAAGLTVLNSMVNVLVRQPSGSVRPYGGVGVGYSGGILHGADFPSRSNRAFDSTSNLAYQFMGGVQWEVRGQTFLFAEYKHLVTTFHWKAVSFDYRANYVLGGIGLNF